MKINFTTSSLFPFSPSAPGSSEDFLILLLDFSHEGEQLPEEGE